MRVKVQCSNTESPIFNTPDSYFSELILSDLDIIRAGLYIYPWNSLCNLMLPCAFVLATQHGIC